MSHVCPDEATIFISDLCFSMCVHIYFYATICIPIAQMTATSDEY